MKRFPYLLLLSGSLLIFNCTIRAQSKEEKKYAIRAKEVEAEIIGVPDPMFTTNTAPETYNTASAVVLAKKVDLFSDLKSKTKFSLFYGKDVTNTIRYALTIHEKVKLQDKNALNEYAEFSFSKISSQSSFFRGTDYTFVGIRLIKPDGTVKKIDIDQEAVNASDDSKEKYKLAIPGLQVGDIIDLYTRVEKESASENPIEPLDIVISGEYPIVNYAFTTKVRNDFAIIYTAANGMPEPKETRDADFIYLKLDLQNMAKTPDELWVYERRERPVFKINITPGIMSKSKKSVGPEKGQVLKAYPKEWMDAELSAKINSLQSNDLFGGERLSLTKEYFKKLKSERGWKELDTDSLIQYLYYYGRYSFLYDYLSENKIQIGVERNAASVNYNFYAYLLAAFNYYNIDYDVLFTVPRSTGTIYTAVSADDFVYFIRAKGKRDYYLVPPDMYAIVNTFPAVLEGQEAYVFKNPGLRSFGLHSVVEKLPVTKSSFNYTKEDLDITLDPTNPQQLHITRSKTVRGNPAYAQQAFLTLFEEYVDKERTALGERTLSDEIMARVGKKRGTALWQEYGQAFAEARKKREEYALSEAESAFEIKPAALTDFKVIQTGNRHTEPDFIFSEQALLDGLVKKAGNNYIVNIGNLVNGQVQVKADQRTRKSNIYMPSARTFDYTISLALPEGYAAEGIEGLNKSVENETGAFISKAVLEKDKLLLSVHKAYHHPYEAAADWNKMLQFMDAAYDFSQQKILLKKK